MSEHTDRTTSEERKARRERAQARTSGRRGADGLTDAERTLLDDLRRAGYALTRGVVADDRRAVGYYGNRRMEPQL